MLDHISKSRAGEGFTSPPVYMQSNWSCLLWIPSKRRHNKAQLRCSNRRSYRWVIDIIHFTKCESLEDTAAAEEADHRSPNVQM